MNVKRRLPLVIFALALCVACASVAPGNDPVVVRAEQTWRIGFDTVDAFVILERQGTVAGLKSAGVHAFAEKLRGDNPENLRFPTGPRLGAMMPFGAYVFHKLDASIQVYKANRTAENKANLQTYLALAEELISTAQKFMKGGAQ